MTDDLQRLISAYLDGDLQDADAETLRRTLRSDPEALSEFVRAVDLHAEMRKVHLEGKGRSQALKEIRRGRFGVRLAVGAVAATLIIAATVWFVWFRTTPVGRLDSTVGQVRLIAGDDRSIAAAGQEILGGQGLETVGDSRATVRLTDGTTLDLKARTLVADFDEAGRNRVRLTRGTLAAVVRPQAADRPMIFATPHGEATVVGTSLTVAVEGDPEKGSTRLEVAEGKVRLSRLANAAPVDVLTQQYAIAANHVPLESKPILRPRVAELVRQMAPGTWRSVPGTKLRQAVPEPGRYPKIKGDPRGIIDSWSGGVLDANRNRLVVWGGGITNYHGNEVYAFDLESLTWERLTEPTAQPAIGNQVNDDGTPISRATYNGLAAVTHLDRMFALGGDSANSAGPAPDITWTFDFATHAWQDRQPTGERPPTWVGALAAYDPATRKVWWGESRSPVNAGLYCYDVDANRWTKETSDGFYYQTGAVDLRRGRLVCVGNGKLFAYGIRGSRPVRETLKTAGAEAFVSQNNPGWDYDSAADRLVGWAGGAVAILHPETGAWRIVDAPGAPSKTINGIFGRWRYVPSLNVFVVVTALDENVHFFKPPAGE
jgi:ferric-dicitrate binding protein FerR (iron transport regulator)